MGSSTSSKVSHSRDSYVRNVRNAVEITYVRRRHSWFRCCVRWLRFSSFRRSSRKYVWVVRVGTQFWWVTARGLAFQSIEKMIPKRSVQFQISYYTLRDLYKQWPPSLVWCVSHMSSMDIRCFWFSSRFAKKSSFGCFVCDRTVGRVCVCSHKFSLPHSATYFYAVFLK